MNFKLVLTIALLASVTLAHSECSGLSPTVQRDMEAPTLVNTCSGLSPTVQRDMEAQEERQGFGKLTNEHLLQREQVAKTGVYRPLKIYFDLSSLFAGLKANDLCHREGFYQKVFEIAAKWWENALQVNDDRSKIFPLLEHYMNASWASEKQDYIGFELRDVSTSEFDIFIKVNLGVDNGYTNYAGPYARHPDSQRPISGYVFITPYGDTRIHGKENPINYASEIFIHEFGHILAFSNLQKMHANKIQIKDDKYFWVGPKTVAKAKEYYGCDDQWGVLLTNGNGQAGKHWDESLFDNELMTTNMSNQGNRLSGITLALYEDTNWYKADYTRSEHFTFLKGKGYKYSEGYSCPVPAPCIQGATEFITSDKQGLGYCVEDTTTGCPIEKKYEEKNCNDGASWSSYYDLYGATYGGNCVIVYSQLKVRVKNRDKVASLLSTGPPIVKSIDTNLSVQAACADDSSSYTLTYKGMKCAPKGKNTGKDAVVTCSKAGDKKWNKFKLTSGNYYSQSKCEDPATFCAARFGSTLAVEKKLCDQSCNTYGRCQKANATESKPFKVLALKKELRSYGYETMAAEESEDDWQCWCYNDLQRTSGACSAV